MLGSNGGLLGKERRLTSGALAATGLWLPNEQSVGKRAGNWPFGPVEIPNIGDPFVGGFFAGYISHTANGVPTHALIVAPRATGATGTGYPVTTNLAYKTTATLTTGTDSLFDGRVNTNAIVTAGLSIHPAANFCAGLNIGGYTDWYLPAQLELDIAYFHLKPVTNSNTTGAQASGINAYSVPPRVANYTATVPGMTSVAAFNFTGAERFENTTHWSSSEGYPAGRVMNMGTAYKDSLNKNLTVAVRAFRRVPI